MDLSDYFEPIKLFQFRYADKGQRKRLGDVISTFRDESHFPQFGKVDLAIVGVKEDRQAVNNRGCSLAPDMIRDYLYMLYPGPVAPNMVDLGNIKQGFDVEDTYFALSYVLTSLLREGIIPIVIGGSQDLSFANYKAYEDLGQIINIVSVDSCFDLGKTDKDTDSQSYLSRIILHQPNFLFNFANIGYQTYFVDQDAIRLMNNLLFDTYRLGKVRADLEEVEPIVRNADMVSIDISSVRHSDAPGNGNASPHGFYGEEMCQIVRYAGLSDKLTSIGFYEVNPSFDHNGQTTHLVAQMIWYFIDGYYNRKHDFPLAEKENYIKYLVTISGHKDEMVFFKSKKSDRWWMEVPVQTNLKSKYERHYLVPCSYQDYQTACKDDIPNRWWQVYQKLM
ncbi:MAG: formimidoylglutamase [Bacteroidetes bacterium]|nr:formimidoylglutamase [Bacteroidota bacterium]